MWPGRSVTRSPRGLGPERGDSDTSATVRPGHDELLRRALVAARGGVFEMRATTRLETKRSTRSRRSSTGWRWAPPIETSGKWLRRRGLATRFPQPFLLKERTSRSPNTVSGSDGHERRGRDTSCGARSLLPCRLRKVPCALPRGHRRIGEPHLDVVHLAVERRRREPERVLMVQLVGDAREGRI